MLAQAWQCFPTGTAHLIVVDPGVGSSRRPILAEAGGHCFVAPDNGVLTMVLDSVPDHQVWEITASDYFRKPVSRTFHGRDIFAPVAAHLAAGVAAASLGKRIDDHVRLNFSTGAVLHIDRFGNVVTSLRPVSHPFELRLSGRRISHVVSHYAEAPPGQLFVIEGSAGLLEVSLNQGSAAEAMGVRAGASVELVPL